MTQLVWSHQLDLRLYQVMPSHNRQSPIKPLRMRVHVAPNVPSFLCLSIPEDIIPLFWDWLQEDRLSIKRSFPCQESKERLATLHYRQEGEETPHIPWVMVQMQRKACVRLVWEKPGTAESHVIGYIPLADIRPIAERAMDTYRTAHNAKRKR